jgi:hypothetical protein
MRIIKHIYIGSFLWMCLSCYIHGNVFDCSNNNFIQSFIKHYEFNPEGRYTHEYHPFLLEKTTASFDLLEQQLSCNGLELVNRIVIFGYEENAVPCYYTNFRKQKINDEAILKNNIGWSLKLHNRFGIMTGFLLKDFNDNGPLKNSLEDCVFEHVNPQSILVFDDMATIFQEHAFGQVLCIMKQANEFANRYFEQKNINGIFECILKFWRLLYSNEFKIGNKQVAGTQDILFSIEYLKHLLQSPVPVMKFFTGPDITYPIEISSKQEQGATLNAQSFIKKIVTKLHSINDRSTAYVFCSFVDGVGKSTMLGNIKNWMKHGDDYAQFEHVDNTSSQLFDLFKFKEKVFIADLPAQISHFTYKPDGIVFVDARTELQEQQFKNIIAYVQNNQDALLSCYRLDLIKVQKIINENGYFAPEINDEENISWWFFKNLFLLEKQKQNKWVPFTYEQKFYLFNVDQPWDIRILQPLSMVKSEGLKNIAAEQMFFTAGVRFPLSYADFLSQLAIKLKERKIEKVVLVDFLSMYPRSSRENVRINYLQQQIALLNRGFMVNYSLYRDFVSGGELLHCLLKNSMRKHFAQSLELESHVRSVLYAVINKGYFADNLRGVDVRTITGLLHDKLALTTEDDAVFVRDLVEKKMKLETAALEQTYGLSKSFVNVQQFKPAAILAFSHVLQMFFSKHITNNTINTLWESYGDLVFDGVADGCGQGFLNNVVLKTESGRLVRGLYAIRADCKDEIILTPILRLMRAQWYMVLSNLWYAEKTGNDIYKLDEEPFWLPPLSVKNGSSGLIYFVQPLCFDEWEKDKKISPQIKYIFLHFGVDLSRAKFGSFNEKPYLLDWNVKKTYQGLYAFDCDLEKAKRGSYSTSAVSLWVNRYQADHGPVVLPTTTLYNLISESFVWKKELQGHLRSAEINRQFRHDGAGVLGGNRTTYLGDKRHRSAIKKFIRLLATLEMVVKDPESDIVIRYGNREDFKAAIKLFEKITIPRYFGIIYRGNLFKNYDDVEPYPSWAYWDAIED